MSTGQRVDASVVKAEPVDSQFTLSLTYRSQSPEAKPTVKTEGRDGRDILRGKAPQAHGRAVNASLDARNALSVKGEDVDMKDASVVTEPACYTVFSTVDDISYAPEEAMKQGLGMVKAWDANIKKLELGSKLRKDVWLREIESLKGQGSPTTMIAVCGATGAGKSSLLNAVMDDNIVPTSGMRACTAVVTEISYHTKKTIEADVSFLSETEWRQELTVLLDDLVDEEGNLKRSTDLRSDAGVAWQKVHAVYPTVTPETLVRMTIDQIISRDPRVAKILGTTKHIVTNDSKTFAQEIGKYIDSKDQKRGDKKGKDKEKADAKKKDQGKSLIEKMREQNQKNGGASTSKKPKDNNDLDGPAFWPLIRQVQVKCNAAALSTGAILVDLPGVADANAARNNIAKDYMKKCDCIWILAPITRAVDDKTARDLMGDAFKMQLMMDGNYDANAITFIATKCDDISCSEVIHALRLEDDSHLEEIEAEIESCKEEHDEWTEKKEEAESSAREIDKSLKQLRPILQEYKAHLRALENGEPFAPTLTAKVSKESGDDKRGKKRKRGHGDEKGSSKRRRTNDSDNEDDDDFIADDDEELVFTDEEDASEKGSDEEVEEDLEKSSNASDEEEESADEAEAVTEESLKANIKEAEDGIKEGRVALSEQRRLRKEAVDALAGIKKRQVMAQRQKNAFCSLKRSEFSRDVLKEDFRVGLKDLDDAAAEQRDPTAFDPTVNLRNYDEIDLPVFTCSARDYVRIKGQVKGDGDPTCFTKPDHTGIPELQRWCHHLTISSRERAARTFMTHLKSFANSVKLYVAGIGDVTVADREALREKWESDMVQDDPESDFASDDEDNPLNVFDDGWASSDDPYDLPTLSNMLDSGGLYKMKTNTKPAKVDQRGEPIGITPRLVKDFMVVVDNCVNELQRLFRGGLEEKCRLGAVSAATAALETSDTFAASMHWGTYRATLRRHGSWRQDLNVELSNPFTRQIASSWSKLFESDLFGSFEKATNDVIRQLVKEVEDSAPPGLKERAKGQGDISFEDAKSALQKTLTAVRDTITNEQKEISRCLAPHVQTQLFSGYDLAMLERGTGSVARQKAVFHNFIDDIKDEMFDGAADVILERLAKAAEAVGKALEAALSDLAETIEVSMGVLWEGPRDDPAQVKARAEVVTAVTLLVQQVEFWQEAGKRRQIAF